MFGETPEISVEELDEKLKGQEQFSIIDVRENWEAVLAHLDDPRVTVLPMSLVAREREAAFPDALRDPLREIVVMCHTGVRSADVTNWMLEQGWKNVRSLAGGIDAYAARIDPSVGTY